MIQKIMEGRDLTEQAVLQTAAIALKIQSVAKQCDYYFKTIATQLDEILRPIKAAQEAIAKVFEPYRLTIERIQSEWKRTLDQIPLVFLKTEKDVAAVKSIGSAAVKAETDSCPDIKKAEQNQPNAVKNRSSWINKGKNFLTSVIREATITCTGNLMAQTLLFLVRSIASVLLGNLR